MCLFCILCSFFWEITVKNVVNCKGDGIKLHTVHIDREWGNTMFGMVENYSQMLNRIAIFTGITTFILALILTETTPLFQDLLIKFKDVQIEIMDTKVSIVHAVIAFLALLISRIFKLHNIISDILKIRHKFDVQYILMPIAGEVGFALNETKIKNMNIKRKELMVQVFYKYASSTNPQIDKHLINKALDSWSWFWVLVESFFFALISLFLFIQYSAPATSFVAIALLLDIFFCYLLYGKLKKAASNEIRAILALPGADADIRVFLNAL